MSTWAAQHLGHLPGRCPACGWHIRKQWHDPDCPDKPVPLLPDGASALIDDRAIASGRRRGGRTVERWKEARAAEDERKAREKRLRRGEKGGGT